ncbi:MAG: membrane protein insertase YidC [Nevskia sp.]|nr:membrane protein insertase YidC [Nevskia sp.]
MENRRMILIALIGVVTYLLYQAWQDDYGKAMQAAAAAATVQSPGSGSGSAQLGTAAVSPAAAGPRVHVHTDLFDADIALAGGELRRLELSQFPVDKQHPQQKLPLLDDSPDQLLVLQTGIAGADAPLASGQTPFHSAQDQYALADGSSTLDVPLEYTDPAGFSVRKVYRFTRGSYQIGLTEKLANHSGKPLATWPYARWQRTPPPAKTGARARFAGNFAGVGVYEQKEGGGYRYKKLTFKDLDKLAKDPAKPEYQSRQTGGWIAVVQQYFVTAIIPPQDAALQFTGKAIAAATPTVYQAQYLGPAATVADGAEQDYSFGVYAGPEQQDGLAMVAPGFDRTLDYGLLASVAEPLFWALKSFHGLTGNWGWAIILLTVLVRAIFYPLSAAQYRSMAKMRKFGPRIQELRERYADDRERLSKAQMELYKKEGFNPLAGCWPLLIQMPVFFGLYRVLAQSVELREAPFILWMQDLSAADPYYVMPVLYGISMWVQQRLSGQSATMDPMQQRMMNIMPIALTGLFLFFPVGLVLYWLVSNSIGILQQWFITRRLAGEESGRKAEDTAGKDVKTK